MGALLHCLSESYFEKILHLSVNVIFQNTIEKSKKFDIKYFEKKKTTTKKQTNKKKKKKKKKKRIAHPAFTAI